MLLELGGHDAVDGVMAAVVGAWRQLVHQQAPVPRDEELHREHAREFQRLG